MSARYCDPAVRARASVLGGAVMAAVREAKRAEAEARDDLTRHEDRRAHREGRCGCAGQAAACPWPWKVVYATPQEAAFAQGKHRKHRRWRQGLNVYQCPAGGHYHTGRLFSRIGAWARAA